MKRDTSTLLQSRNPSSSVAFTTGLTLLLLLGIVVISGVVGAGGTTESQAIRSEQASIPPIQPALNADCTLSQTWAEPGTEVTLDASASQDADAYRYDKEGDGTYDTDTLTQSQYSFLYEQEDTYTPTVQAINFTTDSTDVAECGTLTIEENNPPNAEFTYTPLNPHPGETVVFDPSDTTDPDGDEITRYEWDLDGDSEFETVSEPGETVSRSFPETGSYLITMRARDEHGEYGYVEKNVDVTENQNPVATYFADNQTVYVGQTVTFDAVESYDPDGEIDSYQWDYRGNGSIDNTTTNPVIEHEYAEPGLYAPTLTVVDDDGATDLYTDEIEVQERSNLVCTVSPERVDPNEEVLVDASDSTGVSYIEVDTDGDGNYERMVDGLQLRYSYDEAGEYDVYARTDSALGLDPEFCGTVVVEENEPPNAVLDLNPMDPDPGDTVTLDASQSSDPDGTIVEYHWDLDDDGTIEETTNTSQNSVPYSGAQVHAAVTVTDDVGATDTARASTLPIEAACSIESVEAEVNESVRIDARESTGAYRARFDVDGDGNYEYENTDFFVDHSYTESGTYTPRVLVLNELEEDIADCGEVVIEGGPGGGGEGEPDDGGGFLPFDPMEIGFGALVLMGLGGGAYYLISRGDGRARPPRPPIGLPKGQGIAAIETGTFTTPGESGRVSVTGLDFEPDLLLLAATNAPVTDGANGASGERTDGWTHGKVLRQKGGSLLQSTIALADDGTALDGGMGASTDGHALELLLHYDDPPDRLLGTVTRTTSDGFEMEFDASGLREERSDRQYKILYRAFGFAGDPKIEVGHFRTPDIPGTQSIDLDIQADHVMLFATNTVDDVDSRQMTDLPLGFSVGDVVGTGDNPEQLVRTAMTEPSVPGTASYAAYDDRALHLLYGYDGRIRGRTTAAVSHLGERLDLEYEKIYSGPNKLGSTHSKLVSYVAMATGGVQPAIGYFRLPEPDSEDVLVVDLGFQPSMVEFQSFGIHDVNIETTVTSPLSFGWSHGTVIADEGDIRHQVVDESGGTIVPSGPETPSETPGVAASVRTLADGGRITGRGEVTVTRLTESGFEMLVTDVTAGDSNETATRPLVFYKAWPQPIETDDSP